MSDSGSPPDGGTPDEVAAKVDRSLRPEELPALYLAGAASVSSILIAVVLGLGDQVAAWPMGLGALLVVVGTAGGVRGAVGAGVVVMAVGAVVAGRSATTGTALAINVVVVAVCVIVMVTADLSFMLRRGSVVSPETIRGFGLLNAGAWVLGVVAAIVIASGVGSVDLPSGFIVVPIAGLTAAALFALRSVRRYRSELLATQAPVVGQGPAPTEVDSRWRQFSWTPSDDERSTQ